MLASIDVCLHEAAHSFYAHQAGFRVHRILVRTCGDGESLIELPYYPQETGLRYVRAPYSTARTVRSIIGLVLAGPWVCGESLNHQELDLLDTWRQHWPSWSGLRWSHLYSVASDAVRTWLERAHTQRHLSCLAALLQGHGGVLEGSALARALEPGQVSRDRQVRSLSTPHGFSRPGAAVSPTKATTPGAAVGAPPGKIPADTRPVHVWWDGDRLITAWVDWHGAKHYADGRVISPDGTHTYRAEWQSPLLKYPDGRLKTRGTPVPRQPPR